MTKPKETCKSGHATKDFHKYAMNEESYIHEHLSTINFIAREFNCQNVLEIGTGNGDSTMALASAMQETGGIVTTIDIKEMGQIQDKIIFGEGLGHKVNFIKGDSIKNAPLGFYDLILIDGDHTQSRVKKEIEFFRSMLQDGGFMIFHDTNNPRWCELRHEVHIFTQTYAHGWRTYEWFHCNGLIVIRSPE